MIQLDNKGRMNLNNTFIVDARSGIRSRPAVEGALPEGFRNYVEVPFLDPDTGDSIYMRRPSCKARAVLACSLFFVLLSVDTIPVR
jgi:hypothetical protein